MSKPVFKDVFALSGRRNRQSYFLFGLAITFLFLVVGLLMMSAVPMEYFTNPQLNMAGIENMNPALLILAAVLSIPIAVSSFLVAAQRCRDFGWTGWAALIFFIPYIGAIFGLVILFIPGTIGDNRYGPDPLA